MKTHRDNAKYLDSKGDEEVWFWVLGKDMQLTMVAPHHATCSPHRSAATTYGFPDF
jgi:hypothetical protein